VLLHIVTLDADPDRAPLRDFDVLVAELARFDAELAKRPMIVGVSKLDLPDVKKRLSVIKKGMAKRGVSTVLPFSAATGEASTRSSTRSAICSRPTRSSPRLARGAPASAWPPTRGRHQRRRRRRRRGWGSRGRVRGVTMIPPHVLDAFGWADASHSPITVGLINETHRIETSDGARFVLQRLHPVFSAEVNLDIEVITTAPSRRAGSRRRCSCARGPERRTCSTTRLALGAHSRSSRGAA
jgi:hypothetical protein